MSVAPSRVSPAYLSMREVCARWSISRMTLRRWLRAGYAPQPVRFGSRTVKWLVHEVEDFERRQAEDRGGRHGG